MTKITQKTVTIPTYETGEGEALPLFFEKRPYQGASGKVYPIPYVSKLTGGKKKRKYKMFTLENEYVSVEALPALGGKIYGAVDKTNGYGYIYRNKVIKPAMVGLAGPWVSGGIEFNFPRHHRPTTYLPAEAAVRGGKLYMGEVERFDGMKGTAAFYLEGSALVADVTLFNGTPVPHPFMWWANMAVEVNDSYKIVFPPDAEFVNDHDRRAVLSWPVAKGVYRTARPYDYGEGTDIHAFPAVQVPSSFMVARGQSDGDFVSGYDAGKDAGVVAVAEHRISPGKKLWTWGNGTFGKKWCANLTDDGSRYVELMTGCYTDNQPDFSVLAPYETKKFTQVWYPVRGIGEVKCAVRAGACNLEKRGESLFIGFYSTLPRTVRIRVTGGGLNFEREAEVSPASPFAATVPYAGDMEALTLTVSAEEELLRYTPPVRGNKKLISPRLPSPRPDRLSTAEELYLHGDHLLRYKHFAFRAEDYFREGLARDKTDIRCNTDMGDILYARGDFEGAAAYYTAAIEKATLRNANPYDTSPLYMRALCAFREGKAEQAYEDAYAAIWSYPQRSAGYYLLAKLEAQKGHHAAAAEFLGLSLETNARNPMAKYVRGLLTGKSAAREAEREDVFFFPAPSDTRRALLFSAELAEFGLYKEAISALEKGEDGALKYYHLAYYAAKAGESPEAYLRRAEACPWEREFPYLLESIAPLKFAGTPRAAYYLGCLYYGRENWEWGAKNFEICLKEEDFAPAHRNLALALYDHLGRAEEALFHLRRAHELLPQDSRLFYELTKLLKSMNFSLEERLALYENEQTLTTLRDDCTLDYATLLTFRGDYARAARTLKGHEFHTYEGGEGYLTQHHAWLHFLMGKRALAKGKKEKAAEILKAGLVFPANYGEEKNYFVNDAPIYYTLSLCVEGEAKMGALLAAVSTKGRPTVHSYWQCLALRALGREEEAEALADEMISMGHSRIADADRDDYYGVGAPAYPPFGYDIVKTHTLSGDCLLAFGYLAKGEKKRADAYAREAEKLDCAEFALKLYREARNS